MNGPNLHHQLSISHSDTQSNVSILQHSSELHDYLSLETCLRTDRRFIVLIPVDLDYHALTHRLWELASAAKMNIQLLSLCKDANQVPGVRRGLVTMASLLQDGRISTEVKVGIGSNWLNLVKQNYQPGDVIICFAEQHAGLLHRPLNQILKANLDAPVYILPGSYTREYSSSNRIFQTIAWTGSIGIVVGFFLLQSRIVLLPIDWTRTTLLILTIIFEFWLIWVWHNLFD
jgi:hypothetical protein